MSVYVPSYKNAFSRFLYSFFIQMPLTLWFKYISYPLPQNSPTGYATIWVEATDAIGKFPFPLAPGSPTSANTACDPRALALPYKGVVVVSVPDEPVSNLVKINAAWSTHKDPSGSILQCSGLTYSPDHAFTLVGKHARVYAAASEIPVVLQYEFENIILQRLGYSVAAR